MEKENYVEIYRLTQPKKYCDNYAHTDCIEYITGWQVADVSDDDIARIEDDIVLDEVMDVDEYNNSINANSSETWDEDDYPEEGVRVIVVDYGADVDYLR